MSAVLSASPSTDSFGPVARCHAHQGRASGVRDGKAYYRDADGCPSPACSSAPVAGAYPEAEAAGSGRKSTCTANVLARELRRRQERQVNNRDLQQIVYDVN